MAAAFSRTTQPGKQIAYGGSVLFIRENIKFSIRTDINALAVSNCFECAALDMYLENHKSTCIVLYRSPHSDDELFFTQLNTLLDMLTMCKNEFYIVGDFNINTTKNTKLSRDFISVIETYNLKLCFNEPTRVYNGSVSIIDNIITNVITGVDTRILNHNISDHFTLKINVNYNDKIKKQTYIFCRSYTQIQIEKFQSEIKNIKSWDFMTNNLTVNEKWYKFIKVFVEKFNLCFPKRKFPNSNLYKKKSTIS